MKMKLALVGKFSYRYGRLGSGVFWHIAKNFYVCHTYCKILYKDVVSHSNISVPIWYSMEKLGWAYPPFNMDWILVKRSSDILNLEKDYDRILLFSNVLTLVEDDFFLPNSHKFGTLVDEPKPFTSPSNLEKIVFKLKISTVISHFPYPGASHVPVVYVPELFKYIQPKRRFSYFVEKRCDMQRDIIDLMKTYRFNMNRENWKGRKTSTYSDFYRQLGKSRWVFALDKKNSAGQIIAEASLLGVPSFTYTEKTNGQFVLPSLLRLDSNKKKSVVLEQITQVISMFHNNKTAYNDLSLILRRNAIKRYHEYHIKNYLSFWV